jgi:predicted ferric reductase
MTGASPQSDTGQISADSTWVLRPLLLIALYVGLVLAPILFAYAQGLPPRKWQDELSSGLALSAFAGVLIEFVLSGRFRLVSGHIGIDTTMRFHQLMARSFTMFILVHPFLYVTPMMNPPLPWDTTGRLTLGLTIGSFATGLIAWLALMLIVFFAIFREQRGGSYEAWRLSHGIAAVVIAVFGAHHTIDAGRYSGDSALAVFWVVLLTIAIFTLVWVYALKPYWLRQHPYSVRSVRQVAARTWELVVTPGEGDVIDFSSGQFVWLNVGHSPFSLYENPFSIASAPASRDHLSFVIKEMGDFTRSIGQIAPGTVAYVDGPHGNLTLQNRNGAGIALIAGGVGIAPLLSILRQLCHERDTRPIVLLYGNRVRDQIVHAEGPAGMQKVLDLRIEHVLGEPPQGWQERTGVIDAGSVTDILARPARRTGYISSVAHSP